MWSNNINQNSRTIMRRNNELSWLFINRFRATRYMKVKRTGIKEILRRVWLFSANKIKALNLLTNNQLNSRTQLIVKLNSSLQHITVTLGSRHGQCSLFRKICVSTQSYTYIILIIQKHSRLFV